MTEKNTISFHVSEVGEPILELKENGDIFLHGEQVDRAIDVVTGMREFLAKSLEQEKAQGQYVDALRMSLFKILDFPNMDGEFAEYLDGNEELKELFEQAHALL